MSEIEFENWVTQERERVVQYLKDQNVTHNGVGEWPAFDVAPYFAIWAIQSKRAIGQVGWWAFSGDIPTDYISSQNSPDPRKALGTLLETWQAHIPYLKSGKNPPAIKMGTGDEERKELGDLLEKRVTILKKCYEDDAIWAEIFDEAT